MLLLSFRPASTLGLFCVADSAQGWLLCAELSVPDSLPRALCKTLVLVKQVLLFLVRVILEGVSCVMQMGAGVCIYSRENK